MAKVRAGCQLSVCPMRTRTRCACEPPPTYNVLAVRRECQPQPSVGDGVRLVSCIVSTLSTLIDGGLYPVQDQQILAVLRQSGGHRKRIQRNLSAGGLQRPAAVEQKPPPSSGPDLLAWRRRLGNQRINAPQGRTSRRCCVFHSVNLCAIGNRRPIPNALVVTFRPGAACCRLYSLRSTLLMMSRTSAISTSSLVRDFRGALRLLHVALQDSDPGRRIRAENRYLSGRAAVPRKAA